MIFIIFFFGKVLIFLFVVVLQIFYRFNLFTRLTDNRK